MIHTSLITSEMEPIEKMDEEKVREHIGNLMDYGLDLLERIDITARIFLILEEGRDNISRAWAYYPKSGVGSYITSQSELEDYESFKDRAIDNILKRHDWFNKDVMIVMNSRNMKSVQNGNY